MLGFNQDDDDEFDDFDKEEEVSVATTNDLITEKKKRKQSEKKKNERKRAREQQRERSMIVKSRLKRRNEEDVAMDHLTASQLRRKLMIKRRRAIYHKLNIEQKDRYERYNNSNFAKSSVKKIMLSVHGTTKVPDHPAIIM